MDSILKEVSQAYEEYGNLLSADRESTTVADTVQSKLEDDLILKVRKALDFTPGNSATWETFIKITA